MNRPSDEFLGSLEGKFIQIVYAPKHELFFHLENEDILYKKDSLEIFFVCKTHLQDGIRAADIWFIANLIDPSLRHGYVCFAWWAIKEIKVIC